MCSKSFYLVFGAQAFLKEVLNDLCIYNKRGANQGTYELKPEYKRNEKEEDVKPATWPTAFPLAHIVIVQLLCVVITLFSGSRCI